MAIIDVALRIANEAHAGQTDKSGKPYIIHVLGVYHGVLASGGSLTACCVALLHDVVEDSDYGLDMIWNDLIPHATAGEIAEIIQALDYMTKREGESYFESYLPRICRDPIAVTVKLADVRNNVSRLPELAKTQPLEANRLIIKYGKAADILTAAEFHHYSQTILRGMKVS